VHDVRGQYLALSKCFCEYLWQFCGAGNIYFLTTPRNTTVAEGNRVRLQCRAEGYPENITYRWYRNDVDVQLIPGLMQVHALALLWSLAVSTSMTLNDLELPK